MSEIILIALAWLGGYVVRSLICLEAHGKNGRGCIRGGEQ